jgi:TPR repeat protein
MSLNDDIYSTMHTWLNSAEGGCKGAQYNIGLAFKLGIPGWRKSKRQAFQWFRISAKAGSTDAMKELIYCYTHGVGVKENADFAEFWKKKLEASQ